MAEPTEVHVDPWAKEAVTALPADWLTYVGQGELNVGLFQMREALFLAGSPERWELWSVGCLGQAPMTEALAALARGEAPAGICLLHHGRVVAAGFQGTPREAARALIGRLVEARFGSAVLEGPFAGGLLSAEDLAEETGTVLARLQAERARGCAEARETEAGAPSPLLAVARDLRLELTPMGTSRHNWQANCPSGRQHRVFLSTLSETFGCPYCRVKGGPEALRRWVEARRKG